jgi:chemotaxis protein methyltransferase CheR
MSERSALEDIELGLLLEGIYQHYGFDFRGYINTSVKRRVKLFMKNEQIDTISKLQNLVLHNENYFDCFLRTLSITVTALFRDPHFYLAIKSKVIPLLRTYPLIRIWVAGCSTGEEAYSMAILLHEAGLYHKTTIYATDINRTALKQAEAGILALADRQAYTDNYLQAGGQGSLEKFYTISGMNAMINTTLKKNIVFAQHNLVTDSSFNEFNLILCRNVLIYFNRDLQKRVHQLLYESLIMFGILALGNRETLSVSLIEKRYIVVDSQAKLYKKIC